MNETNKKAKMSYQRRLSKALDNWRTKPNRKPLILRGARQVGKTTLVKEFGKTYSHFISLNLEKRKDQLFFETTDEVAIILDSIFLAHNISIKEKENTLLFIDEIQEVPKVIQLLRYFYEEIPQLHIISAGSLLEFALKEVTSFPVGRVEFLYLHPFNFMEFLEASKQEIVLDYLKEIPIKQVAHNQLIKLFNEYTIIGGMPEIVDEYIKTGSSAGLSSIYESIWSSYLSDSEKYSNDGSGREIIKHIMSVAPYEIDKRIKYQNFGNSNYRSREVKEALLNLSRAKIVQLIYPTTSLEIPIQLDFKKSPKLQILDTGIVNYILGITSELLLVDSLDNSYKGALIPHIINQELISLQENTNRLPSFWVRDKTQSTSEVDLVYTVGDKIIPIEIKSGSTGTLKSLHQFVERANHPFAVRIYAGKFEIQETKTPSGKPYLLMNLPYYLGTLIPDYLEFFVKNYKI